MIIIIFIILISIIITLINTITFIIIHAKIDLICTYRYHVGICIICISRDNSKFRKKYQVRELESFVLKYDKTMEDKVIPITDFSFNNIAYSKHSIERDCT